MKVAILSIALLLLCSACTGDGNNAVGEFNLSNIAAQTFTIRLNTDTTLITKSGVKINIAAQTFQSSGLKEVQVTVKEIISKGDLLKSGVATIDNQGRLLESGGMIRIQTEPRLDINPRYPIVAHIPVDFPNPAMKQYSADLDRGDLHWTEVGPLAGNPDFNRLVEGQALFARHCDDCHHNSLDRNLTGPGLACVEQGATGKSREWLINFTKNSQKMIWQGDKLAQCNWKMYRPVIMTDFEFLSDTQINQIYDYIANESNRRQLCNSDTTEAARYQLDIQKCLEPGDNVVNFATKDSVGFHQAEEVRPVGAQDVYTAKSQEEAINGICYYSLNINNYQWFNIDCNPFNEQKVDAFDIYAEQDLEIYLIFKDRKSLWPFTAWKDHYVLMETEDQHQIAFPAGAAITILAFGRVEAGQRKYCELQTTVKPNNDIILSLSSIPEEKFKEILKKY